MLGSLGALYTLGIPSRLEPDLSGRRPVRSTPVLPVAARALLAGAAAAEDTGSLLEPVARTEIGKHPLLGRHFKSADPAETHFWEITLDKRALPYLDDHRIQGVAVLPASVYLEMALAAAREAFAAAILCAEGYRISQGAFLARERNPHDSGDPFSGCGRGGILSHLQSPAGVGQPGKSWTLHATGKVCSAARRRRLAGSRAGGARGDPGSMLGEDLRSGLLLETPRKRYPLWCLFPEHLSVVAIQRRYAG